MLKKQLKQPNELEIKDLLKHEASCDHDETKVHDSDKLLSGKTTGVCKICSNWAT